jgi:hypothetical protein
LESHCLIRSAREFFQGQFQHQYDSLNDPQESYQWALRISTVLTKHFSVVAVISDDEDNAETVFETLNDRGIGLSTPDLLRNLLLRRAIAADRDEIIGEWGKIFGIGRDTRVNMFLRHYWISFEGDVKSQSLYREMKRKIVDDDINSLELSRSLGTTSELYQDIVEARDDDEDIADLLQSIKELGASLVYPLILSATAVGSPDQIKSLLSDLVTTYVRYSVICRPDNSALESAVFKQAMNLRNERDFASTTAELKELAPNDETFREAFKTVSIQRIASARCVLRDLELDRVKTEEVRIATPKNVHVEHIYPQKPREGERWPNHDKLIARLGNLTLLSSRLNAAIKNSAFSDKKPKYGESVLLITKELLAYDVWNEITIDERQRRMAERAPAIWRFQ